MIKIQYIKSHLVQLLSILTVGFPFVGYKILIGLLIRNLYEGPFALCASLLFILWGLVDLVLNTICLHAITCRGNTHYPSCLLALIFRKCKRLGYWEDLGEALDVMLSFVLVAYYVGGAMYGYLDGPQVKVWNICTVFNVLGAGIARINSSFTSNRNS